MACALLAVVLILSVYPVPPRPYSYVIHVFSSSVVAGVVMSLVVRSRGVMPVRAASWR